jgi:hypothetical protein
MPTGGFKLDSVTVISPRGTAVSLPAFRFALLRYLISTHVCPFTPV